MNQPLDVFKRLAETTNGADVAGKKVECVFIDSRQEVKNGLFIPIQGERFDGHDFLLQAIDNGAIAAIWQTGRPLPDRVPRDFPVFFVQDTLAALQKAAENYLAFVKPIVIAITGSNGKTTTKDLTASLVSRRYRTFKTQGNFNNHIGLPLTVLGMDSDCQVLILEMGMSGFGEISFLSKLTKPDFAVITNIGDSHLEQVGTREGIATAKLEIVDGLKKEGFLIVDGDEPLLTKAKNRITSIRTCGYNTDCDVQIVDVVLSEDGQFFSISGEAGRFYLPLLGKHNIKNACYAIVLAKTLGMSAAEIEEGFKQATLTGMRLERLTGKKGALFINDAYNASPSSMKAAIETLDGLEDYPRKIAVLGDMYELGSQEEALHRDVADAVSDRIDTVITVGEKGRWIGEALKEKGWSGSVYICKTKEEAKPLLERLLSPDTAVLFKASRGMKLETLVQMLR